MFKIIPNLQDYAAIDARCGRLPDDASYDVRLKRFQLAQNVKLVRLWDHGLLPVEMMREMDRIFGTHTFTLH